MVTGSSLAGGIVGTIMDDSWGQIRDGLADPEQQDPLTQMRRGMCDIYRSNPGVPIGFGGGMVMESMCRKYWDDQRQAPPKYPGFQGGQCPGVLYEVDSTNRTEVVATGAKDPFDPRQNQLGFGPIGGIGPKKDAAGNWTLEIDCNGTPGAPNNKTIVVDNVGATRRFIDYAITNVSRADGLPDTCGDAPPVSRPPADAPVIDPSQPILKPTYGRPVTYEYDFDVDLNNNPIVKVVAKLGDVQVYPTVAFSFNPAPPVLPKPPSSQPAPDGTPVDLPAGGGEQETPPTPEEEEEGIVVIGYKWEFIDVPETKAFIPLTSPKVFPETIGNLRLKCAPASGGATFWGDNLRITTEKGSLIRDEPSVKVIGFAIQTRNDYNAIKITPIRARNV